MKILKTAGLIALGYTAVRLSCLALDILYDFEYFLKDPFDINELSTENMSALTLHGISEEHVDNLKFCVTSLKAQVNLIPESERRVAILQLSSMGHRICSGQYDKRRDFIIIPPGLWLGHYSKDEMAAAIGHEIGHSALGHYANVKYKLLDTVFYAVQTYYKIALYSSLAFCFKSGLTRHLNKSEAKNICMALCISALCARLISNIYHTREFAADLYSVNHGNSAESLLKGIVKEEERRNQILSHGPFSKLKKAKALFWESAYYFFSDTHPSTNARAKALNTTLPEFNLDDNNARHRQVV